MSFLKTKIENLVEPHFKVFVKKVIRLKNTILNIKSSFDNFLIISYFIFHFIFHSMKIFILFRRDIIRKASRYNVIENENDIGVLDMDIRTKPNPP